MKPDINKNTLKRIQNPNAEALANELAIEFIDVTKEWASSNLDDMDKFKVREYNEMVGYELRKGYWKIAISDMRSALNILLTSRSLKGKNLDLLFTKISRFEKTIKKDDEKKTMR
jgi:hypothetical protein